MIPNTYSTIAVEKIYSIGTTGYIDVRIQSIANQPGNRRFSLMALVDGEESRVFTPDIWIDRAGNSTFDASILNVEKNKKITCKFNLLQGTVSNNVYHRIVTLMLVDTTDPDNESVAWTSSAIALMSKQIDVPTLSITTQELDTGYRAIVTLLWQSNADFSNSVKAFILRARLIDYATKAEIEELVVQANQQTTFSFTPYSKAIAYHLSIKLEFINGSVAEEQEVLWHAKKSNANLYARFKPVGGFEETHKVEKVYVLTAQGIREVVSVDVKS